MPNSRLFGFVIKELKEVLAPTLFFAIGFNIVVLTTQLLLADYLVSFAKFMVATIAALVVGKSVLIANALPILRRFDTAPLIRPILFQDHCLLGGRLHGSIPGKARRILFQRRNFHRVFILR